MDIDKQRRRQNRRALIAEGIMAVAMVVIVAALALIVSGYWLNSDFEVERQGMLQIYSVPTGATLTVDGEESSWFQRTNTSKTLTVGEHTITLTKDGYDSWTKTVSISEGLLYRVHYPRLFLLEREQETILNTENYTFATVSPNNKIMLLGNQTTSWALLNLDSDKPKATALNVKAAFSNELTDAGEIKSEILSYDWDENNEHVLFKIKTDDEIEWILLDTITPADSLNLTREFSADFSEVEILDNSASTLLAVQNGNLKKIDTKNKIISANLIERVANFDHYDNEIVFSSQNADGTFDFGVLKIGDSEANLLETTTAAAKVAILQFYDTKYLATLVDNNLTLYTKNDSEEYASFELAFSPETLKVGHDGEFLFMAAGETLATLDLENQKITQWSLTNYGWLDNDMLYSFEDGKLVVYDFDSLNRRELAENASGLATITADKWLYYFSAGNLVREKIVE